MDGKEKSGYFVSFVLLITLVVIILRQGTWQNFLINMKQYLSSEVILLHYQILKHTLFWLTNYKWNFHKRIKP